MTLRKVASTQTLWCFDLLFVERMGTRKISRLFCKAQEKRKNKPQNPQTSTKEDEATFHLQHVTCSKHNVLVNGI